jgi:hypothetical protein
VEIDRATLSARFERLRAEREARLAATRLETTLWVEGERLGRWPALQLDLALVGPDAMRARVASLFGTALDVAVRGDSLRAYLPPRRLGVEVNALRESLGVREPGIWACRVLAANWHPGEATWVLPPGDTVWRATWADGADSVAMEVDREGLPTEVELHDAAGRSVRVRYRGWTSEQRVLWPDRIEVEDGAGTLRLGCRVDRVRFYDRPDPAWLALTLPARAERVDWPALRRALERIGERP